MVVKFEEITVWSLNFQKLTHLVLGNYEWKKNDLVNPGNSRLINIGPWLRFSRMAVSVPGISEITSLVLGLRLLLLNQINLFKPYPLQTPSPNPV